ncbi:hypothetical protein Q0590_37450 [Rhodocytophaga aerolata]|uniref:Uncharacterized protein n=1 Tax=Rhodocytophaga aerolata TaxID=455078 RepID=A0ABT8RIT2_9BACT|nr:hypothetical protein [Rhodocytophaga aerolata]MDO1452016.1 hypothetical protein [Rhodocytophaga aerolata]
MKYLESQGFIIRGYLIPPFELKSGKLIRIYIPNFSENNEILGVDLATELIEVFKQSRPEKGLIVKESLPYAKNYAQNRLAEKLFPLSVQKYLTTNLKVPKEEAESIISELGIEPSRRLDKISFTERKYLTISGLYSSNEAIMFDYYGVDAMNIELVNRLIKSKVSKGKCAIGFDNLQYMETNEPFENVERLIIKKATNINYSGQRPANA